jgi:hypothetical protein
VQGDGSSQSEKLAGIEAPVTEADPAWPGTFDIDPGSLTVQYEGGDPSERWARVVPDPTNGSNRLLQFMLKQANVRDAAGLAVKGRVQMNAYDTGNVRAREVRFTTRMYLSQDFLLLKALPQTFSWLTISEWWNNGGWTGQDFPFRVAVNITKPAAEPGAALRFTAHAQTLNREANKWDTTVWTETNGNIEVPIGQWVTLEYHFREGNGSEGRFYLALVSESGVRQVVFDVHGWTQHPDDPAPDGITHFNPLKLYTSKALVDAVRDAGGALQVFWDDLGFRLCRQHYDDFTSPCGPASFD